MPAAVLAVPAVCQAGDAEAGAELAGPCLACHRSDDFTDRSAATVLTMIEEVLADPAHPPDDRILSGTDLADLAAFFARGE